MKLYLQLENLFKFRCNSNSDIIPYIKKLSEMGKFDEPKKVAVIAIILDRLGKLEDEAIIQESLKESVLPEIPTIPEPPVAPETPETPIEPEVPAQTTETPAPPASATETATDEVTATASKEDFVASITDKPETTTPSENVIE